MRQFLPYSLSYISFPHYKYDGHLKLLISNYIQYWKMFILLLFKSPWIMELGISGNLINSGRKYPSDSIVDRFYCIYTKVFFKWRFQVCWFVSLSFHRYFILILTPTLLYLVIHLPSCCILLYLLVLFCFTLFYCLSEPRNIRKVEKSTSTPVISLKMLVYR